MNASGTAVMIKPLLIKFLSKNHEKDIAPIWSPLIPKSGFDGIEFTFDAKNDTYDFLVIYEGLPMWKERKPTKRYETLACSPANTLLITTEPSSIRIDGPKFMRQFGHILTSKSPKLTRHPNHISETPPLRWFYGRDIANSDQNKTIQEIAAFTPTKNNFLSTVCSTKRMSHTVHKARIDFVSALQKKMPELDIYGRGVRPISDKSEAMKDYKYHIAIENHIQPGHWTEKLTDCFLAGCLPFYFGDPEYAKVFPERAAIPINIFDLEGSIQTIRQSIQNNEYELRTTALMEARKLVLEKTNTLAWVARFARKEFSHSAPIPNTKLYSRHAYRRHHPLNAISDLAFRTYMRRQPCAQPLQI